MASEIWKMLISLVYLLISLSVLDFGVVSLTLPNKDRVRAWATEISTTLIKDFNDTSEYQVFNDAYNNILGKYQNSKLMEVKFEEVDGHTMVNEMSGNLNIMLESKKEALNRSVIAAEDAAKKHIWISEITKDDVDYVSAKELKRNDSRLVYNERFKQHIIPNVSSVHIPVEIYDGDVEILNGLRWSAALDKVFHENFEKDPEILWQYFGSQTGFMRTLPASRWNLKANEVDLYDVRRRPWYTQGSSSPKDMMIIIDTSGSVQGQALELIKVTVKSLLNTLGENDFVNIATFSEKAEILTDCFNNSFIQANYRNKQKLINFVQDIEAGNMANFKDGMSFAFEQFVKLKNETEGRRGANCNRMIMLLTDGGTDYAEDVFKKYNPDGNKTYRVFTYAVGPTANPLAAIRWMACANKGYFSQIPAMGAIRSKVQGYMKYSAAAMAHTFLDKKKEFKFAIKHNPWEYVPVISRPPAIRNEKHYKWGNVYLHDMGLGMMTTVTLPVYNKTSTNNETTQNILGVMGIDVTTAEMLKHAPLRKFGPNGFAFAINSNGYIVFHPNLKIQNELKDPPNVDFLEVESESEDMEQLRRDMINQVEGDNTIDTYTLSPDQRHVDLEFGLRKRKYSYTGIDSTTFSLGVSLPASHKHHLLVKTDIKTLLKNETQLLNASGTAMLIAPWDYYVNLTEAENQTGTIEDLIDALHVPDQYTWNSELISHLLWDLKVTSFMYDRLSLKSNPNIPFTEGSIGVFVATNGGLTKIFPKSCKYKHIATRGQCVGVARRSPVCAAKCLNISSSDDLMDMLYKDRDTWKANYFRRTIDSPLYMFTAPYVLKPVNDSAVGHVTITKSVTVSNSNLDPNFRSQNLKYKAAVVGAVFTHRSIVERMVTASKTRTYSADQAHCGLFTQLACHILDDGGFIIATNQDKYNTSVGRFFGRVDPEVMKELFNRSVYDRLTKHDFQSTCPTASDDETVSAAPLSFHIPSMTLVYEFLTFNWWTSVATWTFTNLNLYSLLYTTHTPVTEASYIPPEKTRPCIKQYAMYYFKDTQTDGYTEHCEIRNLNCSREFWVSRIADTNLLLVVTEPQTEDCKKCEENVDKDMIIQEPIENEPEFCYVKPRYRRATEECYDYDEREDAKKCAGSLTTPVSMVMIILVAIATTLLSNR